MRSKIIRLVLSLVLPVWLAGVAIADQATNVFTVGTYNVENWNPIERDGKPDQPKPAKQKQAVIAVIATVRPDVLGIEEMGKSNDLAELVAGLRAKGVDYPYHEWIQGLDADRHVTLISRFPITERFSRTDYTYVLNGKSMPVQRGFLDVLVKVNEHTSFRAIVAHLKSKRSNDQGDQALMRLEEARVLRGHIGKILKKEPEQRLVAMGDFNDTPDSLAIQSIVGESPFSLLALPAVTSDGHDGTHYWKTHNEFSRIDYLVVSPALSNDYVTGSARIADVPPWQDASDHRLVYASFRKHDAPPLMPAQ